MIFIMINVMIKLAIPCESADSQRFVLSMFIKKAHVPQSTNAKNAEIKLYDFKDIAWCFSFLVDKDRDSFTRSANWG